MDIFKPLICPSCGQSDILEEHQALGSCYSTVLCPSCEQQFDPKTGLPVSACGMCEMCETFDTLDEGFVNKMDNPILFYSSGKCTVHLCSFTRKPPEVREKSRDCFLLLSSATFGYANYTGWRFHIQYDPENNFNAELPEVSTHLHTVRAALRTIKPTEETFRLAPTIETYHRRLKWDIPAPGFDESCQHWLHPDEDRGLTKEEFRLIAGLPVYKRLDSYKNIPPRIEKYVLKQIEYYEQGIWEKEDFGGWWDAFRKDGQCWRHRDTAGDSVKTLDFSMMRSGFVHPLSYKEC